MYRSRASAGWALRALGAVLVGIAALSVTLPMAPTGAAAAGASATSTPTHARRSLPRDLTPTLDAAPRIRPQAYADGCHAKAGETRARACSYGDPDGDVSVLLIGDSHAVQWLPALQELAKREGWHLYSLTKSACPVPTISVLVRGQRLRDCDRWRTAALERVARIEPDLVIAASLGRIYELPGARTRKRRDRLWRDAWVTSLEDLRAHASAVVLLGDTPMWQEDPISCLRRHPRAIDRCDTPMSRAVSSRTDAIEREAAATAGVGYLPTADLVCTADPCKAVDGRYLVLVDDQHMTVAWARHIAPRLLDRLACLVPDLTGAPAPSADPGPSPSADPGPSPSASPGAGMSASPGPGGPALPSAALGGAPSTSPGASPAPVASPVPGASPALSCQG